MTQEHKLKAHLQKILTSFTNGLNNIYRDDLLSIILYGSASRGEFSEQFSNLNVLVILKNTGLNDLNKALTFVNSFKFRKIRPIFLSEDYINSSLDVFPIEFLDMKESYFVLFGKDILKDIVVDTKNLRFQCEQELKLKLINIKQQYLKIKRNDLAGLTKLLLKNSTSVIHILKNALRLKGIAPPCSKDALLGEFVAQFGLDIEVFRKISALKNAPKKFALGEIITLLNLFMLQLEKATELVDQL